MLFDRLISSKLSPQRSMDTPRPGRLSPLKQQDPITDPVSFRQQPTRPDIPSLNLYTLEGKSSLEVARTLESLQGLLFDTLFDMGVMGFMQSRAKHEWMFSSGTQAFPDETQEFPNDSFALAYMSLGRRYEMLSFGQDPRHVISEPISTAIIVQLSAMPKQFPLLQVINVPLQKGELPTSDPKAVGIHGYQESLVAVGDATYRRLDYSRRSQEDFFLGHSTTQFTNVRDMGIFIREELNQVLKKRKKNRELPSDYEKSIQRNNAICQNLRRQVRVNITF